MFSRMMTNRVRPAVERLEGRETPSVFVTPAAVPAQSIEHAHTGPAHGHGHHGGVITIHVRADDTAGKQLAASPASSLAESIAILTNGTPGTFETLTPAGTVHGHKGNLEIKVDRSAVNTALQALGADFTKTLQLEVKVSNGTASEVGFLTILPSHHGNMDHGHHGNMNQGQQGNMDHGQQGEHGHHQDT
jgi:hypothetical protein